MYDEDIKAAWARIAKLRAERNWVTAALATLSRLDRRIIELAYLGPKEPERRKDWLTRPTWYAVAADVDMSVSQVTTRASRIIADLAGRLDQIAFDM